MSFYCHKHPGIYPSKQLTQVDSKKLVLPENIVKKIQLRKNGKLQIFVSKKYLSTNICNFW
jgi:hypothetical protein